MSPILFAMHTPELLQWLKDRVHRVEGLSFIDDLGWVATGKDLTQVVRKLNACPAESIEWAIR